jgi:hypothetical protein
VGYTIQYGFVDGAMLAPFLQTSWQDLFRRFPSLRREAGHWEAYAPDTDGGSRQEIVRALSRETVRESLRREGGTQFWLIDALVGALPPLQRRFAVAAGGMEDHLVLLSIAAQERRSGRLPLRTLRAICKLHDFPNKYMGIALPRQLQRVVTGILTARYRREPWYTWQCKLEWADMSSSNCLRSSDTHRFLSFVRLAWGRNIAVPDLQRGLEQWADTRRKALGRRVHSRATRATRFDARFRDFHIAAELYKAARTASRFEQPLAYWLWS